MSIFKQFTIKGIAYALIIFFSLYTTSIKEVSISPAIKYSNSEVQCLAENIYHEARGEPLEGQLAVAQVTINRTKDGRWPSSICKVVYQPNQFSWTRSSKKKIKVDTSVAIMALYSKHPLVKFKAVYYHANYVKPYWIKKLKYKTIIGNHTFYA